MEWSKTHVQSTFHICWAAQAGVYYHYGLDKQMLPEKLCGVYRHKVFHRRDPLVRGFDDYFYIPHSRYTEVPAEKIHACEDLKVLAESKEAGVLLCTARGGRQVFIFGHGEYDRYTLRDEYERDQAAGLDPKLPAHYFPEDNPENKPDLKWRSASQLLYSAEYPKTNQPAEALQLQCLPGFFRGKAGRGACYNTIIFIIYSKLQRPERSARVPQRLRQERKR